METATTFTSDIRVVAIDETHHWTKELQDICGTIKTVYMYDSSVTTNCCEITPSYELTPLYYITENDISDEVDEILLNELANDEARYFHCNVIDELQSEEYSGNFEFASSEDEEYKDGWKEAREYLNGNHLI